MASMLTRYLGKGHKPEIIGAMHLVYCGGDLKKGDIEINRVEICFLGPNNETYKAKLDARDGHKVLKQLKAWLEKEQ